MPLMILLMALAQGAAAPPPTPPALPWHVFGIDSEWTLDIADGRMVFEAKGRPPVSAAEGKPVLGDEGWTWKGGGLTVQSLPLGCQAAKGLDRYPDFVTVSLGRSDYTGCGGTRLTPEDLFGTSWEIVEIAGGKVGGANYGIDFVVDHFLAYDGCHRVDGGYRQAGGKLTLTVAGGTEGGCNPVAARCAARFWQILAEPVAIAFADRNHLTLTGKNGTIRLQTPDKAHLFSPRTLTPCEAAPG
ncbi:MAG: heat shock protein HslJ [Sphingomonadales bacterium]|nr:heat shock protein HslJ [Sphingomonadales bacterium]MEA3050672.1 heat shock protein HslJ [Sphingomonadales bacterium]